MRAQGLHIPNLNRAVVTDHGDEPAAIFRELGRLKWTAAEIECQPEIDSRRREAGLDLKDANQALVEMKQGKIRGAKVLRIN